MREPIQNAIEEFAYVVAADLEEQEGVPHQMAIDPMTILLIIGILVELTKLWCNRTPAQAMKRIANPGFLGRFYLGLKISGKLREPRFLHLRGLKPRLKESIPRAAQQLSERQVAAIYETVEYTT